MVQKEHVENFLRINKIPLSAPDKEIREALIYAKWHEKDVEIALLTLRGGQTGSEPEMTAAHALLRTDRPLAPETLTSLLGIDIELTRDKFSHAQGGEYGRSGSALRTFIVLVASITFALAAALILMYIFKIGPFYSPLEQSFF